VSPTLRLAAPLMALGLVLAPAHGQEAARQPADLVRSLQTLQDEIALGSAGTHLSQRARLAQIAEQLALAKPEVWKEPRNARAAVTFVLSGGDPRILKKLSDGGMLSALDAKLVQGVVAYGEGRSAEAAELLVPIAARWLEPGIAGHLALVQAELTAGKEPRKALAFFDEARLLSPGTLIEEAALRRQISLIAATKDYDRFDMLAANYLRRFARSVYAASFRQQFAADVAARDAASAGRMAKLVGALEAVDAPERRDIYLLIAREALIRGKFELARLAGDKAVHLAEAASPEWRRASLYAAAAFVVGGDMETGMSTLEAMDKAGLDEEDAELLAAARSVAAEVRRLPAASQASADGPPPGAVEAARQSMARVDQLIEAVSK
jgi:chemotaxis protein MotC